MVKAILFDLDGTLLDTLADIRETLNETLNAFGYSEITMEQTREYVGEGARKLVERALPKNVGAKEIDACLARFKAHYATCQNAKTVPYEGELAFLEHARAAGIKLAVVTNKPHAATVEVVRQKLGEGFDFVHGDSGDFPCKPDPSLTRFATLTMRVAPRECVFVGDGEPDVLTAKNAGMRSISVLWGYRTREQLESVGAKEFVSSYEELGEILGIER